MHYCSWAGGLLWAMAGSSRDGFLQMLVPFEDQAAVELPPSVGEDPSCNQSRLAICVQCILACLWNNMLSLVNEQLMP
jgi:hypothetical protein